MISRKWGEDWLEVTQQRMLLFSLASIDQCLINYEAYLSNQKSMIGHLNINIDLKLYIKNQFNMNFNI